MGRGETVLTREFGGFRGGCGGWAARGWAGSLSGWHVFIEYGVRIRSREKIYSIGVRVVECGWIGLFGQVRREGCSGPDENVLETIRVPGVFRPRRWMIETQMFIRSAIV